MACGLALVLSILFATASRAGASVTLVVYANQPISSIATTSASLVWRQSRPAPSGRSSCMTVIRRRGWAKGRVSTVFRCNPDDGDGGVFPYKSQMGAGTSSVVFTRDFDRPMGCCDDRLNTFLRTIPGAVRDGTLHDIGCGGDQIANLAVHAGLAAYTKAQWTTTDCPNFDLVTGGVVRTIALPGGIARTLAGAPPAAFLAPSGVRLALVPYNLVAAPNNTFPPPRPQIQVWGISSRKRQRTISETGQVKALAIGGDTIAALVDNGSGALRIDLFSATTGAATGSTPVPADTIPSLAVYYRWIVYAAGTSVMGYDSSNQTTRTIATPTYPPQQVLAVRGKAVWFASQSSWGRVLSAPLP